MDLLRGIQRNNEITVHISLITIDRDLARRLEPRPPTQYHATYARSHHAGARYRDCIDRQLVFAF